MHAYISDHTDRAETRYDLARDVNGSRSDVDLAMLELAEREARMDTRSDIRTDDTRATEIGVVTHNGRDFASGGFSVDVESGRMVAYVAENPKAWGLIPSYSLVTWGGQVLARLESTGTSRTGFYRTKLQSFRTLDPIAGFYWYGRGLGAGMVLKLRRGRKARN